MVCGIPSKSYCPVFYGLWSPIKILLSSLLWCAESHPNPTVLSAVLCGIPSKSDCLVCRGVWNSIQILLSCLPWCVESPPKPNVLSAVVCGIPSKSYCLVCHGVCNPNLSWCAECHPNPTIEQFFKILYSLPRFAVGFWFESQVPSRLKIICRSGTWYLYYNVFTFQR